MDTGRGTSHSRACRRVEGIGEDSRGDREGIALGEIPNVDDSEMEAANHIAVPMQQSCIMCTCTPEPKVKMKS